MDTPDGVTLVTGATGFTGSHLTRALVADGGRVRVIARDAKRCRGLLPAPVEIAEGDLTDPSVAARAIGPDVSTVYHIAAAFREPGIRPARYREVHVDATRYLLDASLRAGVRRFVHCSTVGVLSHIEGGPADETWPHKPGDVYQQTKSEGETLALDFGARHGLPVAVARPTPIYGPGDLRLLKLFRLVRKGRFVMLGDGTVNYHMVYVDDLVRGLQLVAQHPSAVGEIFILGGAEYCSLNDLVRLIAAAVAVPPPRLHVPAWPVQLAGSVCERICVPLGISPPIYRRRVDFFTKNRAFSIAKARTILGYAPSIDLATGVRRTATWYTSHSLLD